MTEPDFLDTVRRLENIVFDLANRFERNNQEMLHFEELYGEVEKRVEKLERKWRELGEFAKTLKQDRVS